METGSVLPPASVVANDSSVVVTPGIFAAMTDCSRPLVEATDSDVDTDRVCARERPVTATTTVVAAAPLGITLTMTTWAADTLSTDAKEF